MAPEEVDEPVIVPVDVPAVVPALDVCEDNGWTPEVGVGVGVEPPVTDEDEPAVTPLEEGELPEEGGPPPGEEVGEPWGSEVGEGPVDPGVPVDGF